MLKLRHEQIELLTQDLIERNLLKHVKRHFSDDSQRIGDFQTRRVIAYGIERAKAHRFEEYVDICRYINLMYCLGSHFDEDPQLPQTSVLLDDSKQTDPTERMDAFYPLAVQYLTRAWGWQGHYFIRALSRVQKLCFSDITRNATLPIQKRIHAVLSQTCPRKYQSLSDQTINALCTLGEQRALHHGLHSDEGVILYTGIMFVIGAYFDQDPIHPWAATILYDSKHRNTHNKARALFAHCQQQINYALSQSQITP